MSDNLICFVLVPLSLMGAVIYLVCSTKSPAPNTRNTSRYTLVSMALSTTALSAALIAYIHQF